MVNITQDDLLQYLYNELSPEKTLQIHRLLETDGELQERFAVLKAAKNRLGKIKLISPDDRSVDNIFNYSEQGIEELHPGK
jgi:anti-sigma factor RsiW